VSSYSPVGYIVTKIHAYDADIGSNAQLVYSITSHDDVTHLPFDVDASNGAVYVTSSLGGGSHTSTRRDYVLSVTVRDCGSPPLSAGASLVVHVNDSRSFAVAQSLLRLTSVGGRGQFGFNQQILVVLAAVTSIIAMLLVAAIVFVRRRHLAGRQTIKLPPPVTWVNSTVVEDAKTINSNSEMLDSIQQQQQQQQGIKRPAITAATLPLLRVNDLLNRETWTTPTRVSYRYLQVYFRTKMNTVQLGSSSAQGKGVKVGKTSAHYRVTVTVECTRLLSSAERCCVIRLKF